MKNELLEILACPICCRSLYFIKERCELICTFDSLSFKIYNNIPVFLEESLKNICENI